MWLDTFCASDGTMKAHDAGGFSCIMGNDALLMEAVFVGMWVKWNKQCHIVIEDAYD